jgi:hypothetical protein
MHRERKCRTYHWAAFVLSNVVAELVWNTGIAVICFLVWFYPMGLFRNARYTGTVHSRSTLVFLDIWSAFLFGSTLAHALIAGAPTSEAASALGNVLGICVRTTESPHDRLPFADSLLDVCIRRCTRPPRRPATLLDLHVPSQPFHLPDIKLPLRRHRRSTSALRRGRTSCHGSSWVSNVRAVSVSIHQYRWRLYCRSFSHGNLQVLSGQNDDAVFANGRDQLW